MGALRRVKEKRVVPERIDYSTMLVVPVWVRSAGLLLMIGTIILPLPTVTSPEMLLVQLFMRVFLMITGFGICMRTITEDAIRKHPDKYVDVG